MTNFRHCFCFLVNKFYPRIMHAIESEKINAKIIDKIIDVILNNKLKFCYFYKTLCLIAIITLTELCILLRFIVFYLYRNNLIRVFWGQL